jgi:putative transposase
MIDVSALAISIRRPYALVGLNHATVYDAPGTASACNLQLMRLMDEPYTRTPVYGWPRMTAHVRRLGLPVNHQRVQRFMRTMGLQAISPQPRTSAAANAQKIDPYLLSAVVVSRPSQGWRRISRLCTWPKALGIWWQSSTGGVAMCWPGSCPIR